jgi:hypothetical protein
MDKRIMLGLALIVLASGAWGYLDYLNKKEQAEAEEMHKAMMQARAQAREKFVSQLRADLVDCQAKAEKAKSDFVSQNQKPVRHKPGEFTISQAVADQAARMLEAGNANCQQTYDARLKSGS